MTDKPMTPREDVEALARVSLKRGPRGGLFSERGDEIAATLRALLAERDAAYRRGQEDMRREAAHHVTKLVVDGCALIDMEFHIKAIPIKETTDA